MPGSSGAGSTSYRTWKASRDVAEVPARLHHLDVRLGDLGPALELDPEPVDRRFERAAEQPVDHAQGEEVLAPVLRADVERTVLQGAPRHRRQADPVQPEGVQAVVLERIRLVARPLQVARGELVGVDDDHAVIPQVAHVGLERRRVHGDQDVRGVARRMNVVICDSDLETGNARQRAGRRPDLGREVGQRGQIVADQRRRVRELGAGELHAVARITGEADDDVGDGCFSGSASGHLPCNREGHVRLLRCGREAFLDAGRGH